MLRVIFYLLLLMLVCGYAPGARRGGGEDRSADRPPRHAAVAAGGHVQRHGLSSIVEHGLVAVDLVVLVLFFLPSFDDEAIWPLWMTAMQGVSSISHLGILAPGVIRGCTATPSRSGAIRCFSCFAAATWRHRRRLAERGADSSAGDLLPSPPSERPPAQWRIG